MKTKLLISLLILNFYIANAQDFKLGKVSVAELEQKFHPKDSSAVAAILFKKGELRFNYSQDRGFVMYLEVKTRIKIYKKEGYDWANFSIPYYDYAGAKEGLQIADAATYNLVNGKIEKTKLKSDGEFAEKLSKYWSQKKITMPNVKENSIVEFSYILESPDISEMRDWTFQYSIPVNYSEFKTYIPEYLVYRPNQKGYVFPKVTTETNSRKINYTYTSKALRGYYDSPVAARSNEELNFTENITTYLSTDLPAMKGEAFVNNIDNYTASISHELAMTKYPYSVVKTFSTDWQSVAKTIYNYDDFGPELNKTGYFEDDINKLLTGIDIQNERIAAIFNYVKSNVKWNNSKGYSCIDGVKKAYSSKTGNTAEINLMLTAMLRFAGLTANPVLISTRDNGISFFPSRTAFNAVIAGVETANGIVLLDATEKNAQPNILPLRDINWNGRLIRKDGTSIEVDLIPKVHSKETIIINGAVQNDGVAVGKIRKQISDQVALRFRNQNLGLSEDSYLEKLEKDNNDIEISDYKRENDLDLSKPILESYSFKDTKSIEIINDKIYISPLLFLTIKENPFKQEIREYPIDFGFPMIDKYTINMQIPEGYMVESMPANISMAIVDDFSSFKYISVNNGNTIQSIITSTINAAIIPANYYADLKSFYKAMIDKLNEKIVLKKI
jgi:transglutaminase-like putative cysteine protease